MGPNMTDRTFFRSSGFLKEAKIQTESGGVLDLTKIPKFLRTLLVTDGTVTKSLESWFWEDVKIAKESNDLEVLKEAIKGLEVTSGDEVLHRVVKLKGVQSDTTFALARSTVSLNHLPDDVGLALIKGEIGIGELLREKGVETYRDIFNINYYRRENTNDELASFFQSDVLSRSYRIRMNNHPAIIVTEYFPTNIY